MPEKKFPQEAVSNPKFRLAYRELNTLGLWFDMPNPYQIKIGKFNYYWTTGKITVDGKGKIEQRGIDAFINLVKLREQPKDKVTVYEPLEEPSITILTREELADLKKQGTALDVTPPWE